ncbi:adenylate/guanylate cyclase [Candidatus Moduliflexus flocculans]|uniref:Adenylate/guanylate cyclase n=1 Tax=Candidatus Moduliflexus flocculans TaxID=1499966 RepID=A0A0S6VWF4_9BACT|nr:adenylate/guanylate cyclase [Candidatus Moduliflexus flocculans]
MHISTSITTKVTAIILSSLIIGVGLVVFYFAHGQNRTLYMSTEANLFQQADILHESIRNMMLPGEAPLAVSLFNDIQTANPEYVITLYRSNRQAAFSDDSTLEAVNKNLGSNTFKAKSVMLRGEKIPEDDVHFQTAVTTGQTESFEWQRAGKRFLTIYQPLLNLPKCTPCHGSDHTFRGVIAIRSDVTPIFAQARQNILWAVAIFIGVVIALFGLLSLFLKRTVLSPIQSIGMIAAQVTEGNFQEKVRIHSQDELGLLGEKINAMVDGLYERFALSKYVSASTIHALRNSENGKRVDMTMFFSDIRGFTSFSEKLQPEEIVERLNHILTAQTEIIQRHGGDIDKYVGDEIVALFSGDDKEAHACQAALEIQTHMLLYHEEYARITIGIGIHSGEVVLGRIGSDVRADFTVIGDHVNFASRLCSEAKPGTIQISDSVYQRVAGNADVSAPFEIRVKGKELPQKTYLLHAIRVA